MLPWCLEEKVNLLTRTWDLGNATQPRGLRQDPGDTWCPQFGDRAALPHAEALKTRSVSQGHQWFVALAARPALTLPSKTSLDTDVVPPLGPFPGIDPEEIIQQSKASHVPEGVQCGQKHDTARMSGLFVLKR